MEATLQQAIADALDELGLGDLGVAPSDISLEQPARREHGDLSTNVALALAKKAQQQPRKLAEQLADRLTAANIPHVESVEVAGGGFVNFRLANSRWQEVVTDILRLGADRYARFDFGAGVNVNLEFVSANPTGPLHAGHARGAVMGEALARIFRRCGFEVATEFYVNDQGQQMENFAASLKAVQDGTELPEDGYHGDYIKVWAEELAEEKGADGNNGAAADPENSLQSLRQRGLSKAMQDHERSLTRLGVTMDRWFLESETTESNQAQNLVDQLVSEDKAYHNDGAVWLRVSDFGDTQDRVLVKSTGYLTYLTPDLAYHVDKLGRADQVIDIWGADHHDYVMRMKAALSAVGEDANRLEVILCQMVKLMNAGEEVKLSKRAGQIITIDQLLDDIGADATKFAYLQQTPESHLTVDLDVLRSSSMENPVYYVQYAHVRACSILRQVGAEIDAETDTVDPSALELLGQEPRELELMRLLADLPDEVRVACELRAPHRLVAWLQSTAGAFHGFYHDCRVVGDEVPEELTQARLALVRATKVALGIGLDLIGVSAPEEM